MPGDPGKNSGALPEEAKKNPTTTESEPNANERLGGENPDLIGNEKTEKQTGNQREASSTGDVISWRDAQERIDEAKKKAKENINKWLKVKGDPDVAK